MSKQGETMIRKLTLFAAVTALAVALVPGVASAEETATEEPSIAELVTTVGQFKWLTRAVVEAGLVDAVVGLEDVTVFAPNNRSFIRTAATFGLSPGGLIEYTSANGILDDILLYHIVPAVVFSDAAVTIDGPVPTLQGETIDLDGPNVTLNGTTKLVLSKLDIAASNGVIHVIDSVLIPPSLLP